MPTLATTVQLETVLGNIDIALFDEETPLAVENFLRYVEEGHYDYSIFHRLEKDFIIQGGGFVIDNGDTLTPIAPLPSISSEVLFSNERGTIAMVEQGDDASLARNQWFINLEDNSSTLDRQNGGYTVFGAVVGGMPVVEALAVASVFSTSEFENLPLLNYSEQDATNDTLINGENYLLIQQASVVDSNPHNRFVTRPSLIVPGPEPTPTPETNDVGTSGIGNISAAWLMTLLFALAGRWRQSLNEH